MLLLLKEFVVVVVVVVAFDVFALDFYEIIFVRMHRWVHPWVLGSWVVGVFVGGVVVAPPSVGAGVVGASVGGVVGAPLEGAPNDNMGCELHRLFMICSPMYSASSCSLARVVFHVHVALREIVEHEVYFIGRTTTEASIVVIGVFFTLSKFMHSTAIISFQ